MDLDVYIGVTYVFTVAPIVALQIPVASAIPKVSVKVSLDIARFRASRTPAYLLVFPAPSSGVSAVLEAFPQCVSAFPDAAR